MRTIYACLICLAFLANSHSTYALRTNVASAARPLVFLENKGQITDQHYVSRNDIQFKVAATGGLNIYVGKGHLHYQFSRTVSSPQPHKKGIMLQEQAREQAITEMYRLDVTLLNANPNAVVVSENMQDYYEQYYTPGSGDGATVHGYSKITYRNIYPGIDWVLYTRNGSLKHEFVVHPGGDPSVIRLQYDGATGLAIDGNGALTAVTPQGTITEQAPQSFQRDGRNIASSFRLTGNIVTYKVGKYYGDLVIDPNLVWGTYYGGIGEEYTDVISSDSHGNVYLTGYTTSTTSIATTGAHSVTFAGDADAYLVKFNSSGARLWATYYGGPWGDYSDYALADTAGNIFMVGHTSSPVDIATPGSHQPTITPGSGIGFHYDGFIVKFNSAGVRQWGTYLGGSGEDGISSAAVDIAGNVYVCGGTSSTTSMATTGAFQATHGGGSSTSYRDGFISKFSSAGVRLWGTYYGGSGDDYASDIAIDGSSNLYIVGTTTGSSGLATAGAYHLSTAGGKEIFLAKFDASGNRLWGTYYGGANDEDNPCVSADISGNVYIGGSSASTSGIATPAAHQVIFGGAVDGFLAKFNSTGAIQWSTYLGSSSGEGFTALSVDSAGNINGTGFAGGNGISTPGAYKDTIGGYADVFLSHFTSSGSLIWCTYFGGSMVEEAGGIANGSSGSIYISGNTESFNQISTPGAFSETHAYPGLKDAFLAKLDTCAFLVVSPIAGASSVCTGDTIHLSNLTPGGVWSASNGHATIAAGVVTAVSVGLDTITYAVTNVCGTMRSVTKVISVNVTPAAISGSSTVCVGTSGTLSSTPASGTWSSSTTSVASIIPGLGVLNGINPGTTTITYSLATGCHVSKVITVNSSPAVISGLAAVCVGATITLANDSASGTWSSGVTGVATAGVVTGVITGVSQGTSLISYTLPNGCFSVKLIKVDVPDAGAISGTSIVCVGRTVTFSSTQPGGTWSAASGNASAASGGVIAGVTAGPDVITYTMTNSCGTTSATYPITVMSAADCAAQVTAVINVEPLVIYPNPAKGLITVSASRDGVLSIFSLDGRSLGEYSVHQKNTEINLHGVCAPGTYFCRFTDNNGHTQTLKLTVL